MVNFVVKGPFDIPLKEMPNGARFINCDRLGDVTEASNGAAKKAGCYVFSWRAARGSLPIYVGKATRNVLREAFNPRNLNNLAEYINSRQRGRLELSIVIQDRIRMMMANSQAIAEIEEFLIGYAARRNPDLINIHGTGPSNWTIVGVVNHGRGATSSTVKDFRLMMGMASKKKTVNREVEEESIEPATTESDVDCAPVIDDQGAVAKSATDQ